eukprot:GGOE01045703.1.p1 GENE.GGOE01045703.1~~GGOE01045703.1.p1  ORF type:complete len:482 (+),score=111.51 GGOE01045703.1:123-1568(+)
MIRPAEGERSPCFLWPLCLALTMFGALGVFSFLAVRPRLSVPVVGQSVSLLFSAPIEDNVTAPDSVPKPRRTGPPDGRSSPAPTALTNRSLAPTSPWLPPPAPPEEPPPDSTAPGEVPSEQAAEAEAQAQLTSEAGKEAAPPATYPSAEEVEGNEGGIVAPELERKFVSYRPVPTSISSLLNWSNCTYIHRGPPFQKSRLVQVVTVEHFWNGHSQRVLLNFILHTPADWGFFFLHEPVLVPTLSCSSPLWPHIVSGKVQFAPVPYLVRHQIPELNRQSYQGVLKSAEFWGSFAAEFVLIYERDTVLCSNPTMNWEHFLRDVKSFNVVVLGAPWHPSRHVVAKCCNGGLALVNRHLLTFILRRKDPKDSSWDNHVATALTVWHHRGVKARAPPLALSCKFSVETFYPGTYTPIGVHAPWMMLRYSSPIRVRDFIRNCPEVHLLKSVAHVKSRGRRLGKFLKLLNEDRLENNVSLREEAIAPS